jgi:hypothetical protein
MPGLDPGIHVLLFAAAKTWTAGSSPAVTKNETTGHYCIAAWPEFTTLLTSNGLSAAFSLKGRAKQKAVWEGAP